MTCTTRLRSCPFPLPIGVTRWPYPLPPVLLFFSTIHPATMTSLNVAHSRENPVRRAVPERGERRLLALLGATPPVGALLRMGFTVLHAGCTDARSAQPAFNRNRRRAPPPGPSADPLQQPRINPVLAQLQNPAIHIMFSADDVDKIWSQRLNHVSEAVSTRRS